MTNPVPTPAQTVRVALERLLEALAFYERDWMTTYTGYGAVSAMKEQARAALASQPAADLDVAGLLGIADEIDLTQRIYHRTLQNWPQATENTCEAGMCGTYRQWRDDIRAAIRDATGTPG